MLEPGSLISIFRSFRLSRARKLSICVSLELGSQTLVITLEPGSQITYSQYLRENRKMSIFSVSPRGLRDATRNFQRDIEAFEVAVKRHRRQPDEKTRQILVVSTNHISIKLI